MIEKYNKKMLWILGAIFLTLILNLQLLGKINLYPLVLSIVAILFIYLNSFIYAKISRKITKKSFPGYSIYPLIISISSGIVYFLYNLNNLSIALILNYWTILAIIILAFQNIKEERLLNIKEIKEKFTLKDIKNFKYGAVLTIIYGLLSLFLLYLLYEARLNHAIRSFWLVLPVYFLPLYLLNTALLLKINRLLGRIPLIWLINIFHINFTLAFAFIIYRLGYGFDPFIHQSTMASIAKKGMISPKPYYYLGYYGLIVILHKITAISIAWLDKLMIFAVLNTLFLPILSNFTAKKFTKYKLILLLAFLIFPFSLFIVSTPQAIANLIALSAIFYVLGKKKNIVILLLLLAATTIIHPLTGIPLFFILVYLKYKNKFLRAITWLSLSLALPASFLVFNIISPNFVKINLSWTPIADFLKIFIPQIPQQFVWWKDLIYLWIYNLPLIILISLIAGFKIIYEKKKYRSLLFLSGALLISYLLSLQLKFNNLIYYEEGNYSQRILVLATYLLYPIFFYLIYKILKACRDDIAKNIFLTILSILILISVYSSYPRDDQYHLDRGYNLSQADITAVHYIQEKEDEEFLVLAAQMTSVAALNEFGFYNQIENKAGEKIFYYPIPTSGDLYKSYLKIVYEDQSRAPIDEVFANYQVEKIYVVIPHYWNNATNIILNLQESADEWIALEGNQIYVFEFEK